MALLRLTARHPSSLPNTNSNPFPIPIIFCRSGDIRGVAATTREGRPNGRRMQIIVPWSETFRPTTRVDDYSTWWIWQCMTSWSGTWTDTTMKHSSMWFYCFRIFLMHVNLGQADQFQDRNYPYLGSIVQYTSTLWNASKFNNKWEEKEEVLDSHEWATKSW